MKTLVVPVADGVDEALQSASARWGRDKGELVSEAIRAYLEREDAWEANPGAGPPRHISVAQACRIATAALEEAEARRADDVAQGARAAAIWEMDA